MRVRHTVVLPFALVLVLGLIGLGLAGLGLMAGAGRLDAAPRLPFDPQARSGGAVEVDVELVLAVDVSYSMDPDEQALQREGYRAAITSAPFLNAIREGVNGRVAVTYVEWAGTHHHQVLVPWRLIEGPELADAFVAELDRAPPMRASRTSISGALLMGADLFKSSGYRGLRRIIDVSGDGVNNNGPPVHVARDEVLAQGIVINGLPIMLRRPNSAWMDLAELDIYYEDCVIGGPGAFVIPVRSREQFRDAIRTKLVLEIAGLVPEAQPIPVQAKKPRVSCLIGEEMWQRRWGN